MKTSLFLTSLAVLAVLGGWTPAQAAHDDRDHFADAIITSNFSFLAENNVLDAPDRAYADSSFRGAALKLDMGLGEEGTGNLTVYYETHSAQGQLYFEFYSATDELLHSYGNFVPIANMWTIEYPLSTPYRYVRITNNASQTIRIDAIESAGLAASEGTSAPAGEEPAETPEAPEVIKQDPLNGSIVKLADDWNDATDADKTIYMLDARNHRHIVPNEKVFDSWSLNFSDVQYIGSGTLTGMPLGANVFVRPGTYLVKITTSPKVYAVASGGILRWIQTEELAEKLYGVNWKARVIDVPEVLFARYPKGETISSARYPGGSYIKDEGGSVWYVSDTQKRWSIGPKTLEALELQDQFLTTGMTTPELAATHEYMGRLPYADGLRWPF